MHRNAHATANLLVQRDLERQQSDEWFECHRCGAKYQSRNARVLCCSDEPDGGDAA